MKKQLIEKFRQFEDPKISVKFFSILVGAEVILFGFVGIRNNINKYISLHNESTTLGAEVKNLQNKKYFLVDQDSLIRSEKDLFSKLDQSIPLTPSLHTFLAELVMACSENGFDIVSLRPNVVAGVRADGSEAAPDELSVSLELRGNVTNTYKLVGLMRDFTRKTVVDKIVINIPDSGGSVDMELRIFYVSSIPLDFPEGKDATIDIGFLRGEMEPAHERN